ncbi:M48 family metalloprotease [Sphingomonas sp. CGMCC 1.13654]|uniref:M48 family metalloprotease n=1 Tax=Sphingomonas chungangi TaxID=2683589 RepID=A0A838LBA1_9SPHN|nr:M48 family metallopeptidase [Sphingomonas chungangi]MBA2936494.1 M48 family metalloprotease [Sphingomonas chungangi]MVW55879.1 M48 family metalloprotease [Sphingomonas chungangi]
MILRRAALTGAALASLVRPALAGDLPVAPVSVAAQLPSQGLAYQPQDKVERGIWMQMDEAERKFRTSSFVIRDKALNDYVRGVFCRTVGDANCAGVRIYIVRTAAFNASMAPNGMMLVWSGLFLRVRDEAQFAAVLGHEYTHYANKHSLQLFREVEDRSAGMAFFGAFGLFGLPFMLGELGSAFAFSRDMEREADAGSVTLLAKAGYDPMAASKIWEQLRAEQDATAVARNVASRKDKNGGMFATHPPTAERMATLKDLASKQAVVGTPVTNRAAYMAALAPFWAGFVDDQIKLNDFGGTDFLLTSLGTEGWTPQLYYARGELLRSRGRPEDLKAAIDAYRSAATGVGAVPEAWRGLGLALLRNGQTVEGQDALRKYMAARPDAADKPMMTMLAGG